MEGAGRNKVSIIFDAKRFDLLGVLGSRYPEMKLNGDIKSFDN